MHLILRVSLCLAFERDTGRERLISSRLPCFVHSSSLGWPSQAVASISTAFPHSDKTLLVWTAKNRPNRVIDNWYNDPYASNRVPDWATEPSLSGTGVNTAATPSSSGPGTATRNVEQQRDNLSCPDCNKLLEAVERLRLFQPTFELKKAELLNKIKDLEATHWLYVLALFRAYYKRHHHDEQGIDQHQPPE